MRNLNFKMGIEARKYKLIEQLMNVSDETVIKDLESIFKNYLENIKSIKHLIKPTREKLDVDELIKKQNYQGADKKVIDNLIDKMAIEEPIEDLLKMI